MVDQQRFADFARIGSDWFWETDCDDRFTYFSTNRSRDGLDLTIFIGRTRRELAVQDPENLVRVAAVETLIRDRQPIKDMLYLAGRPGAPVWCQISAEPRFDEAGTFIGYRGVGRDVTDLMEARQALEIKSRTLEEILKAMPDGVELVDAGRTTLAINDQLYDVLGLTRRANSGDATYDSMLEMARRGEYGPGDPEELTRQRIEMMLQRVTAERHVRYQRELKTGRWMEVRLRALDDGGFLSLYRDITDDKRREAEIERQFQLLQTIFAHFPGGIAVFDKDLRLAAWNEHYAEIIGADPAAVRIGATPVEILTSQARLGEFGPVEDPEAEARRRWALYQTGEMDFSQRQRPNGRTFEMRRTSLPGGGSVSIYIDITEQKRAARELEELNATLEERVAERTAEARRTRDTLFDALESVNQNLIVYDREDRLAIFTKHLYLQYPTADKIFVIGRKFDEILRAAVESGVLPVPSGEDQEAFIADRVDRHRRADGSVTVRHRPNGTVLHISEHRSQSGGIVAVGRDVTEQFKVEAQLREAQRMEAIGQLTGGLAHDLNNYLAVIMGNLDLLAEHAHAIPEMLGLIEGALDGAERGAELTRSLLAFSRRQPLDPKVLDVGERIFDVTRLLKRTIGEKIVVEMQIARDLWPVMVDGAQLDSAIVNLANNARDAMPEGGTLTIAARNSSSGAADGLTGDHVLIEVTDTGRGMDSGTLGQAFEPFFSTKKEGHGTGLGLSMVHGFVHQSGGTIRLASSVGKGTVVRILLPRSSEPLAIPPKRPATAMVRGTENVVLVDDNDDVRETVAEALKSLGYRVTEAASGDAALDLLESRAGEFDVVVTDVIMPGKLDGLALGRIVRKRWPELGILLTTGFAGDSDNDPDGGAAEFSVLTKPYRKEELARMLRSALVK
jgi:signal transduction histidine kinase/CheY-like chemotaxis protein